MKEVRPTFMGAVPRVYEKAYAKLRAGLEEKRRSSPVTRALVDWALGVGRQVSRERAAGRELGPALALQARLADRLMFDKLRATFGGRLRWFISGGAPLAKEIQEFFHATGLLILEGYGLTETTAATNLNRPGAYRFGSVGQALPGVEVKIAGDGEVLMRGDNILREYWGQPEATREAIDEGGWFHSGDIGVIEDGYLRITDRKKDVIVTAGGKNVAPQNLEALIREDGRVSQVAVFGEQRPYLVALVTLQPGLGVSEHVVQEIVDRANAKLAPYETIKKFRVLSEDFTVENDLLTPTLKVKRRAVGKRYQTLIDGMYETGR
jgi:long-chain acyl-CoA synthetase